MIFLLAQREQLEAQLPMLIDGQGQPEADLPYRDVQTYYFVWHFAHPQAWEKVLAAHPNLTLCLAHFGADAWKDSWLGGAEWIATTVRLMETYPNLYTDISYLFIDEYRDKFKAMLKAHPKALDKIMFGTDWYMIEFDKVDYSGFCTRTKTMLDAIGKELGEDLWTRFSVINPMRYLKLDQKADSIAQALLEGVKSLKTGEAKKRIQAVERGRHLLKRYSEAKVKALAARLAAKP